MAPTVVVPVQLVRTLAVVLPAPMPVRTAPIPVVAMVTVASGTRREGAVLYGRCRSWPQLLGTRLQGKADLVDRVPFNTVPRASRAWAPGALVTSRFWRSKYSRFRRRTRSLMKRVSHRRVWS